MKTRPNDTIHFDMNHIHTSGLTKREYFAAISRIDEEEIGTEFCKAVTGIPIPDDVIERYKWFEAGKAALRVIKADALINELNKEA